MRIFIVVPVYNEQTAIPAVIADLKSHGYENIIVVDDGSTDKTGALARRTGVRVLRHLINRGMGAALQTGNRLALSLGADIIVHFDGDGQMQATDIKAMVEPIIVGTAEVTLGTRFRGAKSKVPASKQYIFFPLAKVVNYFFTGLWLSDVHNGFRALSRDAAEKIKITQDGMAHNSEITQQIGLYNLRWQEVPVTIIYHHYGQGIGGGFRIIRDLFIDKFIR